MSRPTPSGVDDTLLASVQAALDAHRDTWQPVFETGSLVDPSVKDACARFLAEEDDVVAHADDPHRFSEPQRAAMAWAQSIGWNPDSADDALWERLHANFTEPQLVELGTFISLVLGQRNWLRTLGEASERLQR